MCLLKKYRVLIRLSANVDIIFATFACKNGLMVIINAEIQEKIQVHLIKFIWKAIDTKKKNHNVQLSVKKA